MASGNGLSLGPEGTTADRWSAGFLACLGVGLIVTATDTLLRGNALPLPTILYLAGGACLAAGIKWDWLKPQLSPGLASSVGVVANDFRYWLVLVAVLVFIGSVVPAFFAAPSATNSMASRTPEAAGANRVLSRPSLDWDGSGPIRFSARFQQTGEKLPIYLDWDTAYGNGASGDLIMGGFLPNERIQIGLVDKYVVGQELNVVLTRISGADDYERMSLQWGESDRNRKVGLAWGNYMGRIVVIGKEQHEESYPFLLVSRSRTNAAGKPTLLPPVLIGPSVLNWIRE